MVVGKLLIVVVDSESLELLRKVPGSVMQVIGVERATVEIECFEAAQARLAFGIGNQFERIMSKPSRPPLGVQLACVGRDRQSDPEGSRRIRIIAGGHSQQSQGLKIFALHFGRVPEFSEKTDDSVSKVRQPVQD